MEQRGGGLASAADVQELTERVRALESQKAIAEKERADAQRKVDAHVAHAAKIKATYNQLAGWYNNLRQEYAELQTKAKSQAQAGAPADGVARELSASSSASNLTAEELKKIKEERDSLKSALDKEREEKAEEIDRNSLVLATKAKALDDLRMQWESANSQLRAAQDDAIAHQKASESARRELEDTKTELEEAKMSMTDALAKAKADLEQLEEDRLQELEELRQKVVADSEMRGAAELEAVQKKHAEELAEITLQASIKDDELQVAQTRLGQLTVESEGLTEEIDKLKMQKIAAENSLKEQLEKDRAELESAKQRALDDLEKDKEDAIAVLKEEHEKEMGALKAEKDAVAERELVVAQTKSDELGELQKENDVSLQTLRSTRVSRRRSRSLRRTWPHWKPKTKNWKAKTSRSQVRRLTSRRRRVIISQPRRNLTHEPMKCDSKLRRCRKMSRLRVGKQKRASACSRTLKQKMMSNGHLSPDSFRTRRSAR